MSWLLPVIAGVGGFLSNTKGARTQTYQDPKEYIPLRDRLIQYNMDRLNSPTALPAGFLEGGIQRINQTNDLSNQNLMNRLTSMGLSNSPVAGNAFANSEVARQGQINTFQNIQAPAYEQQLRQQDVGNAMQMFGMRNPNVTRPGSAWGGALGSAAEMLAYLYGSGAMGSRG